MTTARDLAAACARMRTDCPALADDLVTDTFRLWVDTSVESDGIVGRRDLAEHLTDQQARSSAQITATLVLGDHARIAYAWDLAQQDGSVLTGIDVSRRDSEDRITATWSIVGDRGDTVEQVPPGSADPARMRRACAQWTEMWNGRTDLVHELVSDDFRIWFGATRSADDTILGPQPMQDYVTAFRATVDGVRFTEHGGFVVDGATGRAAVLWTVTLPPAVRPAGAPDEGVFDLAGIDLFQFVGDRIARVWSITGSRPHTLPN